MLLELRFTARIRDVIGDGDVLGLRFRVKVMVRV